MSYVPVQLPPGVARLGTAEALPGRWYDANLIRWRSGVLAPVGGWERMTSTPLAADTRLILPWRQLSDILNILCAGDDKLLVYRSDGVFDITPTSFVSRGGSGGFGYGVGPYGDEAYGTARSVAAVLLSRPVPYSADTWGQNLLFVSGTDGRLLQWDPTTPSTISAAVTGAPVGNLAVVVSPERHVLLLGAAGEPRRVAWCSREDITDWNFASTTNTAGFFDLETNGRILTGVQVREGILIFTDADVWLARYVGQPFIYGFEKIAEGCQLLSPQGVATFSGRAAWMGLNGFYLYEAGDVRVLPCDVGDFVYDNLNLDAAPLRVAGSAHGIFPEFWWFYPSGVSGENDRYVFWNWSENYWSIGALARSAMAPAGAYSQPVATGVDKHLYEHEKGFTSAGVARLDTIYAETAAIPLAGDGSLATITRAIPDFGSNGQNARLKFYSRLTPHSAESAFGPYPTDVNGYAFPRLTGRQIRMRVEAAVDADWTMGRVLLDAKKVGKR
jgi:hypothetical protein